MVMERDTLRSHLKVSQDGRHWDCEFCGHRFGLSVPNKTFISHLEICGNVPLNVKDEAVQALQEINNEGARKRGRTMPVSGNWVQKEDIQSDGSRGGDNCEWIEQGEGCISRPWKLILEKFLRGLEVIEAKYFGIHGKEILSNTTFMTGVYSELLEERKFFDYQEEKEWSYLDYQRRKEWSSANRHVYWMTVTRDHKDYEWQDLFAKRIGLDLSWYKDERERAVKLAEAITKKGGCIFFLDNLRKAFDADKVGIPDGCKLVFTTRTRNVCERMGCRPEHMIHLQG